MFTRVIEASSEIDAPPEAIWAVLTDLEHYGDWNPFTYHVESTLEIGTPVRLSVQLTDDWQTVSINTVTHVDAPHTLAWRTQLGAKFIMHSHRFQTLEPLGDGRTRYTTRETFRGPLVPVVMMASGEHVQRGFETVARTLKERVENRGQRPEASSAASPQEKPVLPSDAC